MTRQSDEGWRRHVVEQMLPRMDANAAPAATFEPGPASPQPLSFAGPHTAPPDDPALLLEGLGLPLIKMTAIHQRALDLHAQIPTHEQVSEARLEALGHKNRISDLERHQSDGGFVLPEDAPQVRAERKKKQRAEQELARLTELKETRSIRWNAAAQLHQAVSDWVLRGVPANCVMETIIEDQPVSELLKKGETISDGVSRYQLRQRELAADRHRVNSSPWPSSVAKAAAKEFIDRLANAGAPNLDGAIEHGMDIVLATKRLTSSVFNVNSPGAIAYAEADHTIGLLCWLFPDQILSKICVGLDEISDDKNALSQAQREEMLATIDADDLAAQRAECSLIWAAAARGEVIDFRPDTTPMAALGVSLRTAPRVIAGTQLAVVAGTPIVLPGRLTKTRRGHPGQGFDPSRQGRGVC